VRIYQTYDVKPRLAFATLISRQYQLYLCCLSDVNVSPRRTLSAIGTYLLADDNQRFWQQSRAT